MDAETLHSVIADQWHWGAFDGVDLGEVKTPDWFPEWGVALGQLAVLDLGGYRLRVPRSENLYLIAGAHGAESVSQWKREAGLYVVGRLSKKLEGTLKSLPREVMAVSYLAHKGTLPLTEFCHEFKGENPRLHIRDRWVSWQRRGSTYWIDPQRGIVG